MPQHHDLCTQPGARDLDAQAGARDLDAQAIGGTSTPGHSPTPGPSRGTSTLKPSPSPSSPSSAPSSPPSRTPSPSPSVSSSSPAASPSSTSWAWCSSAPFGTQNTPDGYDLYNNEWNSAAAGPQTICGNSGADWQVTSTQVMFWVDNHGQTPAGTKQATVTFGGLTWDLYATSGYWAFVLNHNASSGIVDLLAGLRYLRSTGALSGSDQLWQVNFGWEICSTSNQPEVFRVDNYSLASS